MKISLSLLSGRVKVRVGTFNESEYQESLIASLPNKPENILWHMDSAAQTSLLIRRDDPHYCFACSYLIAVETDE